LEGPALPPQPVLGPGIGDIELRLLRVFRAVVERGGLSAAQVTLGLGLATISKHMADLETRLGMRLCARGHEKFSLTEQGELVYRATLEVFGSIEHLRQQVGGARQELMAEITLGLIDGVVTDPACPITRAIGDLRRQAPLVRLQLLIASPDEIEVGLLNGRMTLGIIPAYRQLPGLEYFRLYEEASDLYCARGHPFFDRDDAAITQDDLARQAYVDRGYVESTTKQGLAKLLMPSATAWHVEGVALLILSGGFIGFLPVHYAASWCATGQMRPLLGGAMRHTTEFCLVRRRSMKVSRPVGFVMDLLRGKPGPGAKQVRQRGNKV
jgi:DNA-binding transcriptional LysR family regulator